MAQWGIELTSNDPALLSFLAKYREEPSWSVVEVAGKYYLLSSSFQDLTSLEDVRQNADTLLFLLNGIMKLKFKSGHLDKAGNVVWFDDHSQIIRTTTSKGLALRVNISAGEAFYQSTDAEQLSSMDIWLKVRSNPLVEEALQYYANPYTWHNLEKIFEIISKDTRMLERKGKLPKNTFSNWVRGWGFDFLQTAHSYHWSGLDARHSSVESEKKAGVTPMPLNQAIERITDLLMKWLLTNT
jgi:hypothetical protein